MKTKCIYIYIYIYIYINVLSDTMLSDLLLLAPGQVKS